MIHHFADLLDRKDDYWAMVPNRERFAFALNGPVADKQSLQIATIGADTPFWEQIFECGGSAGAYPTSSEQGADRCDI